MPHAGRRRSLDELDISGTRVAVLGSLVQANDLVEYTIRIVDTRTGRVRRVRDIGTGEGGQFVFGLGFHAGLLGWAKSCTDDPSGCIAGAFRYHLGSRRTDQTHSVGQSIGFSLSGSRKAYVLQGTAGDDAEGDFKCPCRLERRTVQWG